MLKLSNIEMAFPNHVDTSPLRLFHRLNLTIARGSFTILMGNNGTGKSTLFNLISGRLHPTRGTAMIDGQNLAQCTPKTRAQLIATVTQDPRAGTLADLSIAENMAFAARRGHKRRLLAALSRKRRTYFKERLELLGMGLEKRLSTPVKHLSGGQRQALSLIMATLLPCKVLLLDEITAALDPRMRDLLMEKLENMLKHTQQTCVMITHNMTHAQHYGDRLLILQNGRFIHDCSGLEKEKLSLEQLTSVFDHSL